MFKANTFPVKTAVSLFYMLPNQTRRKAVMPTAKTHDLTSPAQAAMRTKILQAARRLLEQHGLPGTNMMDVAKAAGIGRATLYRYYSTREHLVSDLTLEWSLQSIRQLTENPVTGKTVGARLESILDRILQEAHKHPGLSQAALSSLINNPEQAMALQQEAGEHLPELFLPIIQAIGIEDFTRIINVAHRLMLGTLMTLGSDGHDSKASLETLLFTLQRLIGKDVWETRYTR